MGKTTSTGLARPRDLRCEHRVNPLGIDEVRPRLSWKVSDDRRGAAQTAYQIVVASMPGDLTPKEADVWDSGKVESDASVLVEYDGPRPRSRERLWWKVRTWDGDGRASAWSEAAWWEMGLLRPSDWKASWIAMPDSASGKPCPHLRRRFTVGNDIVGARAYVSARGVYELLINGQRIGDAVFRPGWTDYRKRIQYDTYDITDLLQPGENVVAAIVGDGWYCGHVGWCHQFYGDHPSLLVQLRVDYETGRGSIVVSDESWKASGGPILSSDMLMGETYDARCEMPEWADVDFDDTQWADVTVEAAPDTPLVASCGPPVRAIDQIKPIGVTQPQPDVHVFDLGQNMVGVVRLKVRGEAGRTITLRHAEVLNEDGTIYTDNLRSAKATDRYTLRGDDEEVYEPRFTFHGFRYVEVTGWDGKPPLDAVTGIVLHSDTPPTGSFECSNKLINQLQHNIVWGQKGNFLEVPTDCPQRDERLGWTGDAQVFISTACFNMDVAAFFTKWLIDLEDGQEADGGVPDVAPNILDSKNVAAWADAMVVCPWTNYLRYGDQRMLDRHYKAMTGWIDYMKQTSHDLIRPAIGHGDWLAADTPRDPGAAATPKDLIGTAYFAGMTDLVACAADVLGKSGDGRKYRALAKRVRAAFNKEFVSPNGRLTGEAQTAYVLALFFDLLPEDKRPAAVEYLVRDIEKHDNHLTAGFVGARDLNPVLTRFGRLDLAYTLMNNTSFPSWLYAVEHGATTIWERWDGWTEERGFQSPGMNSFNHYAFGAIGDWLYRTVAGVDVDPDQPGYKHIVIHPQPGGGLTHAKGELDSPYGRIVSDWILDGRTLKLRVVIPANTHATVHLPGASAQRITEGGAALADAEGISNVRIEDSHVVCDATAGAYSFTAPTS